MSGNAPALLAAAAGVGLGHAILPDHWVPLAVLGRTRRYPLSRVARLSGLAGVAHVLVSIILGAIIIAIGLRFRSSIQNAHDTHHRLDPDRHRHWLRRPSADPTTAITTTTTTTITTTTSTATRIIAPILGHVTGWEGWRRSWSLSGPRPPLI